MTAGKISHKNPYYQSHYISEESYETRPNAPPILMTAPVFNGFKAARPNDDTIKNGWFKKVVVEVSGYTGDVFGGDVHFKAFKQ